MDLDQAYQNILQDIRQGHRAFRRWTPDELEFLEQSLSENKDHLRLEKVLCLVEHSAALHLKFEGPLLVLLNSDLPDHILVFALQSARKHIIEARFQRGQRLSYEFLESLKKLLHSPSPEVVEWTLRTIEGCGNQGVYFLREFDKIKPPPWKWFNAHQRAVREICTLLERRWSPREKPQPK